MSSQTSPGATGPHPLRACFGASGGTCRDKQQALQVLTGFFSEMARKLHGEWGGTGGVILGCTEIELLLRPGDVPT